MAEQLYILRPPGWQPPEGYVDMQGIVVKEQETETLCDSLTVGDFFAAFEQDIERDGKHYEERTYVRSIRQVMLHQGEILIWAEAETLEVEVDE